MKRQTETSGSFSPTTTSADLKVLVGQVDLQAQRVDALGERPCLQLSQREDVLAEAGQHVLHQDDLVTHLRLLQAHNTASSPSHHVSCSGTSPQNVNKIGRAHV